MSFRTMQWSVKLVKFHQIWKNVKIHARNFLQNASVVLKRTAAQFQKITKKGKFEMSSLKVLNFQEICKVKFSFFVFAGGDFLLAHSTILTII